MSQNDFNIANQGFPATRADINSALQALASTSAGTTEPGTIYAYQMWYDETADLLKMRNGDNDAWITLAAFNQATDEWEIRTAVIQAVDSAGVVIKTDDGVARISVADSGAVSIGGNLAVDTNTLFVDAANNRVGVGTSSPTKNLDIVASGSPEINLRSTSAGSPFFNITPAGGGQGVIRVTTGQLVIQSDDSNLLMNAGGSERLRIDSAGSVGIGTSSPSSQLEVSSGGDTSLTINAANNFDSKLVFSEGGSAEYSIIMDGLSGPTQSLQFYNNRTSSEAMRIDSSGNLLVGTTDGNFTNGIGIKIANSASARLKLCDSDFGVGALDGFELTAAGSDSYIYNLENGFMAFGTNALERARVDASGNLLVKCTSLPSASVSGGALANNGDRVTLITATSSTISKTHAQFFNPNGQVGSITTNGSATTYSTSSDHRLKEDVQPMVGSVDRLMALKPVNFAWKVDGSRVDGFLAHEAQEVVPEAVTGEKDAVDKDGKPEYQGIDQSKLLPVVVAALQEALTEIADLKARVAALEA
jgi:hypothetical protein